MNRKTLIVTRHPALVEHLRDLGLVPDGTRIIEHATPEDVAGAHVIGVLPLRLASLAWLVTEVPLDIPAALRGRELTLEEVSKHAGPPVQYVVRKAADYIGYGIF